MTQDPTGRPTGVRTNHAYVHSQQRLCLRPERQPGVVPACEDDAVETPGDYHRRRKSITLPTLKFLEGRK